MLMFSMSGIQVVLLDTTLSYLNADEVGKLAIVAKEFPELPIHFFPFNWNQLATKAIESKLPEVDTEEKLKKQALSDYLIVARIRQAMQLGNYTQPDEKKVGFDCDLTQLIFWKILKSQKTSKEFKFDFANNAWCKLLPAFTAHHEQLLHTSIEKISTLDRVKVERKDHQLRHETALVITCDPDINRPYCNQLQLGDVSSFRYRLEFYMIAKPNSPLGELCNMLMDCSNFPVYSLLQLKFNGEIRNLPNYGQGFMVLDPIFNQYGILNWGDSLGSGVVTYPTRLTDHFSLALSVEPELSPAKASKYFCEVMIPAGFPISSQTVRHLHLSKHIPDCKKIEELASEGTHCTMAITGPDYLDKNNPFESKAYASAHQEGRLNSFLFDKTLEGFYQTLLILGETQPEYLQLSLTELGIQLNFKETVNSPEFHRCQAAAIRYVLKDFCDINIHPLHITLKKNITGEFDAAHMLKILNHVLQRLMGNLFMTFQNESWYLENLTDHPKTGKGAVHANQQTSPVYLGNELKEYKIQTCWMYDGLLIEMLSEHVDQVEIKKQLAQLFGNQLKIVDRFIYIDVPLLELLEKINESYYPYEAKIYLDERGRVALASRRNQGYAGQQGFGNQGGKNKNPNSSLLAARDGEWGRQDGYLTLKLRQVIKDNQSFPKTIYTVMPVPEKIELDTKEWIPNSVQMFDFFELGRLSEQKIQSVLPFLDETEADYRTHLNGILPLRPVNSLICYLKDREKLLSVELDSQVTICKEYEKVSVKGREYWKPAAHFGRICITAKDNPYALVEKINSALEDYKQTPVTVIDNFIVLNTINPETLLRKLRKDNYLFTGMSKESLLQEIKNFNQKQLFNLLENFHQLKQIIFEEKIINDIYQLILSCLNIDGANNPLNYFLKLNNPLFLKKALTILNLKVTDELVIQELKALNLNHFLILICWKYGYTAAIEKLTEYPNWVGCDPICIFVVTLIEMKKQNLQSPNIMHDFEAMYKLHFSQNAQGFLGYLINLFTPSFFNEEVLPLLTLLVNKWAGMDLLNYAIHLKDELLVKHIISSESKIDEWDLGSKVTIPISFNGRSVMSEENSVLHHALVSSPIIATEILNRCQPEHFWVTNKESETPLYLVASLANQHDAFIPNLKSAMNRIKTLSNEMKLFIKQNEEKTRSILTTESKSHGADESSPLLHQVVFTLNCLNVDFDPAELWALTDIYSDAVSLVDLNGDNFLLMLIGANGLYIPGLATHLIKTHPGILDQFNLDGDSALHVLFTHPVWPGNPHYGLSRQKLMIEILSQYPDEKKQDFVNRTNDVQDTVLHCLLTNDIMRITNYLETVAIIKLLASSGANLDLQNLEGSTPLHLFLMNERNYTYHEELTIAVIQTFANLGANFSLPDNKGQTLLSLAEQFQNAKIIGLIQQIVSQEKDRLSAKLISSNGLLAANSPETKAVPVNNNKALVA